MKLIENVYKQFGLPDKVITDREGQFDSLFFQELCKALEAHPQSDGSTKRFNQEIELYLSIYCISNPQDWSNALPTLEFTHNNRQHADRTQTPFINVWICSACDSNRI